MDPRVDEHLAAFRRGCVDLIEEKQLRGMLEKSLAEGRPLRVKFGMDPSSPDLHVGHGVQLRKLRDLQDLGHQIVLIVGDSTAMVGDPSGRNKLRPVLTREQVEANLRTYEEQAGRVLDLARTEVRRNSEWFDRMDFYDVLQLTGRMTVARMLERDTFQKRVQDGEPIGIHEFLYPLMQGYDSVVLECDVELGGHDQIFNLNVGRHLMEAWGQRPQICLTVALLVGTDGVEKMSKSKGNHVGITEPPDDMFGKVMSIDDDAMWKWYELLSDATPDRDQPLEQKKALAHAQVARFHGAAAADDTLAWWNAGRPPRNLDSVSVESGPLYAIVAAAGLAKSNGEARRKITQGGVSLDGEAMSDPTAAVAPGSYLLRVGKKSSVRVVVGP